MNPLSGFRFRSFALLTPVLMGMMAVSSGCATETEELGDSSDSAAATRTEKLKVMTLNLRHDVDQWERRFELVADEIVRLDPDVIGLQEIEIGKDQGDKLNDLIAKRGHAKYHSFQKRKTALYGFFTGEGVGIFSRYALSDKDDADLAHYRRAVHAKIALPSGVSVRIFNTHFEPGGEESMRVSQAEKLLSFARGQGESEPAILTGDFNASPTKDSIATLRTKFVDSYPTVHGNEEGSGTSPIRLEEGAFTQRPTRRIDYVMARSTSGVTLRPIKSDIVLKNHDSKGFYPSDHYAIMTTYEVVRK
ncbi:MAG: endonuclease/exonuclease/phosphatase family protein [Polyangiaceae bacterium]|nr:endonuclease/exonuclease/phosphatase family protein [Polyangiaceae bacterium]